MKNRASIEATNVHVYEGHWSDSDYIIERLLSRRDLTDPTIKPTFIVSLSNGEKVLVGWTDKQKQRLFFIRETVPNPGTSKNRLYTLKVIRMRGVIWKKTVKAVKRGMVKWFQTDDFGDFSKFAFPLIRKVYPQLIANDLVSVQPMSAPTSLIFYMNHKYGKPSS